MMPWRAWRRIFPCAIRWWMGRVTLAPLMAIRRRPCVIPKPAWRPWLKKCWLDIDKDTVDFVDNFDGSLKEPAVLPARLAQSAAQWFLGYRGWHGHQYPLAQPARSSAKPLCFMIDHQDDIDDVTVEDLMKFIPGPDFATGGIIVGSEGIRQAYITGKGKIVMQGRAADRRDQRRPLCRSASPKFPIRSTRPP